MLNKPFLIIGLAIVLLLSASFIPKNFSLLGIELKQVDLLSDLKTKGEQEDFDFDELFDEDSTETEAYLPNANNVTYASLFSFAYLNDFLETEKDKIDLFLKGKGLKLKKQKLSGNTIQLRNFYSALRKSKSKQVRIAHYGDSAIEGDLITADLRQIFQRKFGGRGAGFVSITSKDVNFRMTTRHSFSNDWEEASLYTKNPKRLPLGISGEIFINKANSWVEYKTTRRFSTVKTFDEARLFYSDASASDINYSFNNGAKEKVKLQSGKEIKQLVLSKENSSALRLEFPQNKQGYFYGVSLESGPGVYIDNYPLRGNTGVDLQDIEIATLKQFDKYMNYDLIIFEFGLNALSAKLGNFERYQKSMVKVINQFKKAFPKAGIILVGAHDKSIKQGGKFTTDPTVAKLIKAQIKIAQETGIAFWNLFEAMGGKDSMIKWVNSNPPLAHKDYIHFNDLGAKKEAELFSEAILSQYK